MVSSRTGRAQLAVLDEPPGGPDREGAGHRIDAGVEAGDVGHVEAVAGLAQELLRRSASPGLDDQVGGARPTAASGRSRAAALAVVSRPARARGARRRRGR